LIWQDRGQNNDCQRSSQTTKTYTSRYCHRLLS
jgi:hypothetical protein